MKRIFVAVMFLCLVVFGIRQVEAQPYDPSYYDPYWNGSQYQFYAQQSDPYYELHALHYQLYLPEYQAYPGYPYCCVAGGFVVVPQPITPPPPVIVKPHRPHVRRK